MSFKQQMRFFAKNDEDAFQARYVKNGIWSLVSFTPTNRSIKYLCCPYPNDHIEYRLTFLRESGFFLTNVVVPAIFLTALMLVGFWLHPDSGEKVTFTVTNLLALTLFQQLVADKMPPIGEPRSILGIYPKGQTCTLAHSVSSFYIKLSYILLTLSIRLVYKRISYLSRKIMFM